VSHPHEPVELPAVADPALQHAARRCGLDPRGARLIRLFATAVYHLPAHDAVARIAVVTSPDSITQLATSLSVTRWLSQIGFPTVEPLPVDQPVATHGCAVTFWRYIPPAGPEPGPADLGHLLRQLHKLEAPPVPLPAYRPLVTVGRAIETSRAIGEDDRSWLRAHCEHLQDAFGQLSFSLPVGMIHGDAHRGNLLRDGPRVVLADWDAVCAGPREIDLIPTLQAARFGLAEAQRDAFISAYGHDIRTWDGYSVLREIRELSTTSALLRDGHANAAVGHELQVRLGSLRLRDNRQWMPF
jgi:hypothetical protein